MMSVWTAVCAGRGGGGWLQERAATMTNNSDWGGGGIRIDGGNEKIQKKS